MKIYWTKIKERSSLLAEKALKLYNGEDNKLCYNDSGKPYFPNSNVFISISHSGDLWVCVLAREKVGIDIEKETKRNFVRISERFFTEKESAFVKSGEEKDFFELWVRKEAYVKYLGNGISYGLNNFELIEENNIIDEYDEAVFKRIHVEQGYRCAICTEKRDGNVEIKLEKLG